MIRSTDTNHSPVAELRTVLTLFDWPDAVTLSDVAAWIVDPFWRNARKNRRAIPHRFAQCGYVPIRNDEAEDGLWPINGKRQVVYVKATLPLANQLRAVIGVIRDAERRSHYFQELDD